VVKRERKSSKPRAAAPLVSTVLEAWRLLP
jgi:hypothetical protein